MSEPDRVWVVILEDPWERASCPIGVYRTQELARAVAGKNQNRYVYESEVRDDTTEDP